MTMPTSRNEVMSLESEATVDAAARVRDEVKAFIQGKLGKAIITMITLRKDGRPHARPVWAFVEGWTVGTMSQGEHLKNKHIRNNPEVGYLWTEVNPTDPTRPKTVWLQGTCEIVTDPDEVAAFFARRRAATGQGDAHPNDDWERLLLRTTPSLVRAEGFLEHLKPALYRTFPDA